MIGIFKNIIISNLQSNPPDGRFPFLSEEKTDLKSSEEMSLAKEMVKVLIKPRFSDVQYRGYLITLHCDPLLC